METEENGENSVTAWHVQKLYRGDECKYYVLPYDLLQTIKNTTKMESGIRQTMKFLVNSRLTEDTAKKLCAKKNRKDKY